MERPYKFLFVTMWFINLKRAVKREANKAELFNYLIINYSVINVWEKCTENGFASNFYNSYLC